MEKGARVLRRLGEQMTRDMVLYKRDKVVNDMRSGRGLPEWSCGDMVAENSCEVSVR